MANIHETIKEIEKVNSELARQVKKYVKDHSYGLVFEENLPEAVRLYTKTPSVNDVVNIRPPRYKEETEENKVAWVVKSIVNGIATIERDSETKEVPIEDLVTIVDYKAVIYPGLKEIDRVERGNPDDPYHMVINAENYHALETLVYAYAGKVDCIYIDPPYNKEDTQDWKYNCDYVESTDKYRHSKWLAFIKRRLQLADKLLNKENSVLIVTIDEVEYLRLGLLLEQMFPTGNIQMVCSVIKKGTSMRQYEFSRCNEYIYYVRFGNAIIEKEIPQDASSSIPWRPLMRSGTGANNFRPARPNSFYPIYVNKNNPKEVEIGSPILQLDLHPSDIPEKEGFYTIFPIDSNERERVWGTSADTLKTYLEKGYARATINKKSECSIQYITTGVIKDIADGKLIVTGKDDFGGIKGYYEDGKAQMPQNQWNYQSHNATTYGTNLLVSMIGNRDFPFPKSLYAVRDTLKHILKYKPNALVVDFFAGSGTTLHAVNLLNAEDGGHRRCICVTNNEVSAKEHTKYVEAGLRQGEPEWEQYGIANYITWERTKCFMKGIDINGVPLQGNYGCELDADELIEAEVTDAETGKKVKGKVFKKVKKPYYPELANINMSDGFKANVIFCELTYEDVWNIRLDKAFNAIAPILWMLAGCQGEIIRNIGKTYLTTDFYGVLFDYSQASKFCDKVKATPSIKTVFVVTDDQRRYSNMCKRLPNVEVHRLYESFLKTFEICGEGGLD